MLVSDVLDRLRTVLRDPSGNNVNEYTDAELIDYASEGFRDSQRECDMAGDIHWFETDYTFTLTSGQKAYPMPEDFKRFIWLKRVDLSPEDDIIEIQNEVEFRQMEKIAGSASPPRGGLFYRLKGANIHIVPVVAGTIASAAVLSYIKNIVPVGGWTTSTTTIDTEMPDDWIDYGVWRAAAYATHQDENDPGYFWNTAEFKLTRLKPDYAERRKGPRFVQDPFNNLGD